MLRSLACASTPSDGCRMTVVYPSICKADPTGLIVGLEIPTIGSRLPLICSRTKPCAAEPKSHRATMPPFGGGVPYVCCAVHCIGENAIIASSPIPPRPHDTPQSHNAPATSHLPPS